MVLGQLFCESEEDRQKTAGYGAWWHLLGCKTEGAGSAGILVSDLKLFKTFPELTEMKTDKAKAFKGERETLEITTE